MALLSRQIAQLLWHGNGWMVTVLFSVGLVVRLSLKDHFPIICAIYYVTPPLLLGILAALAGIYWFSRAKKRVALGLVLTAMACIIWSYKVCYVHNSKAYESNTSQKDVDKKLAADSNPARSQGIRLLYWNPWHGTLGWASVIDTIAAYDADVIALVESGRPSKNARRMWQEAFPGYEMSDGRERMLILCRGKIESIRQRRLTSDSLYQSADIEVRGQRFKLFLVDLGSATLRSRKSRIEKLVEAAHRSESLPMVMAGDFNLPYDSVHFSMFQNLLQNAYLASGEGYAPTWPMLMPLIQIDHVWTNPHIRVNQCVTGWTCRSDHRPIVVDFELLSANPSASISTISDRPRLPCPASAAQTHQPKQ